MPSIKQRQACCRPGDSVLIFFTQHPSFFAPLAYFPRVLCHRDIPYSDFLYFFRTLNLLISVFTVFLIFAMLSPSVYQSNAINAIVHLFDFYLVYSKITAVSTVVSKIFSEHLITFPPGTQSPAARSRPAAPSALFLSARGAPAARSPPPLRSHSRDKIC